MWFCLVLDCYLLPPSVFFFFMLMLNFTVLEDVTTSDMVHLIKYHIDKLL